LKERSALCKEEEETKMVALLAKRNQHLAEQIKDTEASIDEQIAVIDTELEWVDDVLEMIRALGIKVKGDGME
jgi:predicted transcriptional regulator